METPEQKKDRERLARYIQREQLTSVMSNSKWRRVRQAIPQSLFLRFRVKNLRGDEPAPDCWEADYYHVFGCPESIEWLEIETQESTQAVTEALRCHGIPFTLAPGGVRIWGYVRPGASPEWVF